MLHFVICVRYKVKNRRFLRLILFDFETLVIVERKLS